jgi:U3 small nucleolar RNA-associated protein 11
VQDYSARARDYGEKKKKLKALKQKIIDKNPDEFYFGMMSRKGPSTTGKNRTGTVNGDRGNEVLSQDAVRLYKTQDLGYVRTMRNKALKEVEALEKTTKGIKAEGKKIVFVDEEEQKRAAENVPMEVDSEDEEEEDISTEEQDRRLSKQREAAKTQAKLTVARERLKALTDAELALELQRAKMAKSPTVGGISKAGVKYKVRERKR